ncbi:MAG: hypothetical protein RLZ98_3466 [Pseudomonadota bacterium]|jgi:hypothetical protein
MTWLAASDPSAVTAVVGLIVLCAVIIAADAR